MRRAVLFVAPRFHSNYRGWVENLKDFDWDVYFIVSLIGPSEDHSGAQVFVAPRSCLSRLMGRLNVLKGANDPNAGPSLFWTWASLRKIRPDVVVIRDRKSLLAIVVAIICKIRGLKTVNYQQDPLTLPRRESLVSRLYNRFFFAESMSPIFGYGDLPVPQGWTLVPFEAPKSACKREALDIQRKFLVTIGKFGESRKRLDLLFEALVPLAKDEFHLTIIGSSTSGVVPDYVQQGVELVGKNQVSTLTNLPHSEVLDRLSKADIFVLPASDEPASISVIEALSCGIPVICSDTCGTRDYIGPGMGLVFKSGDAEDLSKCIRQLLSDNLEQSDFPQNRMWERRADNLVSINSFLERVSQAE